LEIFNMPQTSNTSADHGAIKGPAAPGGAILLCDVSGSMEWTVGTSERTRRDKLIEAVTRVVAQQPGIRVFAFNDHCLPVPDPQHMPEAEGGTDLAGALRTLREYRPERLVLVTDGEPDNEGKALAAALQLNSVIHVLFVGDETRPDVIRFLNKLRSCTRKGMLGKSQVRGSCGGSPAPRRTHSGRSIMSAPDMKALNTLAAIMERATGSTFEPERLAALAVAGKWLTQHAVNWRDLLLTSFDATAATATPPPPTAPSAPRSYRDSARECLETGCVDDWETNFLTDMITKGRIGLTPRQ
jgi:hypothetical protein